MPGTYSQLLLHIVFSTKHRLPWIAPEIAERLYPYVGGIVRAERGVLYAIGGAPDHVHLFLRWRPDGSVSDLMRTVKSRSSKWIHESFPTLAAFAWQEGYSVFTVSKSQEEGVKRYIAGQAEHHRKKDFKSELLKLLQAHGIDFEEKYVFDSQGDSGVKGEKRGFARDDDSSAPPGQTRGDESFSTGFATPRLRRVAASPVATVRRPAGAKSGASLASTGYASPRLRRVDASPVATARCPMKATSGLFTA